MFVANGLMPIRLLHSIPSLCACILSWSEGDPPSLFVDVGGVAHTPLTVHCNEAGRFYPQIYN